MNTRQNSFSCGRQESSSLWSLSKGAQERLILGSGVDWVALFDFFFFVQAFSTIYGGRSSSLAKMPGGRDLFSPHSEGRGPQRTLIGLAGVMCPFMNQSGLLRLGHCDWLSLSHVLIHEPISATRDVDMLLLSIVPRSSRRLHSVRRKSAQRERRAVSRIKCIYQCAGHSEL